MRIPLIALGLGLSLASAAAAQPLYVIAHVDLAPPLAPPDASQEVQMQIRADTGAKGVALLKEMAVGCTAQAGCLRFEVLQTVGGANHLTLVEVWKDEASMQMFEGSARVRSVRERLAPYLGSPFDQRAHLLVGGG